MGDAETAADQNRFRELSKEFSHLNEVVSHYQQWMHLGNTLADARQMQDDPDAELRELASEEALEANCRYMPAVSRESDHTAARVVCCAAAGSRS